MELRQAENPRLVQEGVIGAAERESVVLEWRIGQFAEEVVRIDSSSARWDRQPTDRTGLHVLDFAPQVVAHKKPEFVPDDRTAEISKNIVLGRDRLDGGGPFLLPRFPQVGSPH